MTGFWSVVFSPTGLGIYALFWLMKLTVGTWIVRKIFGALPDAAQTRMRNLFNFRRSTQSSLPEQST